MLPLAPLRLPALQTASNLAPWDPPSLPFSIGWLAPLVPLALGATYALFFKARRVCDEASAQQAHLVQSLLVTPDMVTYGSYVYLMMRIRRLLEEKGGLAATHELQHMATIEADSARPYVSPDIVLEQPVLEEEADHPEATRPALIEEAG